MKRKKLRREVKMLVPESSVTHRFGGVEITPQPWVDLPTAAAHFMVSVDVLRRYIRKRKVRFKRLGVKLIRVRLSEVEEDLEKIRKVGRPKKERA